MIACGIFSSNNHFPDWTAKEVQQSEYLLVNKTVEKISEKHLSFANLRLTKSSAVFDLIEAKSAPGVC